MTNLRSLVMYELGLIPKSVEQNDKMVKVVIDRFDTEMTAEQIKSKLSRSFPKTVEIDVKLE